MSDDVVTTQKIVLELELQVDKAEKDQKDQPTIQGANHLHWLKSKLEFYKSKWYPQYKEENQ